ncbi:MULTISPECIES: beta-N-acetylhexosaminidase [Burkholderia]|uniref:beta-N-acetylhexosaminidase n=1 Tax=Burkholderia TaxID=32008 RepID=UPI000A77D74F|nr:MULTISPECIES: beta-N-acetylhexosaminidase [unclassified Burkholderia]
MNNKRLKFAILGCIGSTAMLCAEGISAFAATAAANAGAGPKTLACTRGEWSGTIAGTNPAPAIVPTLQTWKGGVGAFSLTSRSRIVIDNAALSPLANKFAEDLQQVTGMRLPVVRAGVAKPGDVALSLSPCGAAASTIGNEGNTFYAEQSAVLRANTLNGAFYATRTLLQMLTLDGKPAGTHSLIAKGYALDYPRYRERSIMFDVARKFATKTFLMQYMKFMSWYKLNTLHLHLNDFAKDANGNVVASFRLKSSDPAFNGPVSDDGLYYTEQDWAELEAVANAHGITIVPEFDTPGHSQAFGKARPDLADAAGFLDPTKPGTLPYVESVFSQFLPWFKSSRIHIGGDEVSGFTPAQIVPYLNGLSAFLKQRGKTVQAWGDQNYIAGANAQLSAGLDKTVWIQRWINWGAEASLNYKQYGYDWTDSYGDWYIVAYGPSYFNPNGLSGNTVYTQWNAKPQTGSTQYPPIGGQICVWNDNGASKTYTYETDIHALLKNAIPAAGQIYWTGQQRDAAGAVVPYSAVGANVPTLGYGPGVTQLIGVLNPPA